jgi:ribonuclease HI
LAEYNALLCALEWAVECGEITDVQIFTDSTLVKNQLDGRYRCKKSHLKKLRDQALNLLASFNSWAIHWNGRSHNVSRFGH